MVDVAIVGGGPAGLSAALVLGRCRRSVWLADAGEPRNALSAAVHNLLGQEPLPAMELRRRAREQLGGLPVEVEEARVRTIDGAIDGFRVQLDGRVVEARRVLLATGMRDRYPSIEGLGDFLCKGVYQCPYCDAWEHRGRPLAAYGSGKDGVDLALGLRTWSERVYLCSDTGKPPGRAATRRLEAQGVRVYPGTLRRLEGEGRLGALVFANGDRIPCEALFVHAGQEQASELPIRLGCPTDARGRVRCDVWGKTRVPGVYVAGDMAPGLQFVVEAAAGGARAAFQINRELRKARFPG